MGGARLPRRMWGSGKQEKGGSQSYLVSRERK